jgi:hypothetical protein
VRRDPAGDIAELLDDPKVIPPKPRACPTDEEANVHGFWMGLEWLEANE